MDDDPLLSCFVEGAAAAQAGAGHHDNPYLADGLEKERAAWWIGFNGWHLELVSDADGK